MKRWIHASENHSIDSGFLFEFRDKAIFLVSNNSNITDRIVKKFINAVCDIRGLNDETREQALNDKATLQDFRRRITKSTLEHKNTDNISFWNISGNGFTLNFPEDEFASEVVIIEE